jgi:ferredoxin
VVSDEQLHVRADRDVCIGAGMCVLTAGAVFDQDDDGIVVVLDETPAEEDAARQAVANCPSGALSVSTGVKPG